MTSSHSSPLSLRNHDWISTCYIYLLQYDAICTLSSPVWLIPPDMLRTFLRPFPHWRGGRTALQVGHLGSKSPSEKKQAPNFWMGMYVWKILKITSKPNGIQWLTRSFSEQKKEDFQPDPHGANMWQPTKVTKNQTIPTIPRWRSEWIRWLWNINDLEPGAKI